MPEPEEIAKALRAAAAEGVSAGAARASDRHSLLPLSDAVMGDIIRLQLGQHRQADHGAARLPFTYDDDVVELIASRCTEPESGGRMIDAILTNTLLPDIAGALLNKMLAGEEVARVQSVSRGASSSTLWIEAEPGAGGVTRSAVMARHVLPRPGHLGKHGAATGGPDTPGHDCGGRVGPTYRAFSAPSARAAGGLQHGAGKAAEHRLPQPRMAVAAHHQQPAIRLSRGIHQYRDRRTAVLAQRLDRNVRVMPA